MDCDSKRTEGNTQTTDRRETCKLAVALTHTPHT